MGLGLGYFGFRVLGLGIGGILGLGYFGFRSLGFRAFSVFGCLRLRAWGLGRRENE